MLKFIPSIPSLQILWKSSPGWELECLSIERLQSGPGSTFAIGAWSNRKHYYSYPVTIERRHSSVSISNYLRPPQWSEHVDWEYFDGKLEIALSQIGRPEEISWTQKESGKKHELAEGSDWEYYPPAVQTPEPRGKITVERFSRPLQELMRGMLLSTEMQCAISGCQIKECLEAAHILPVKNGGTEVTENMMLLRADLHRLFDSGLLSFRVENGQLEVFSDPAVSQYVSKARCKSDSNVAQSNLLRNQWLNARLAIQPCTNHLRVDA